MEEPLIDTEGKLTEHLAGISAIFVDLLEPGTDARLDADWGLVPLVAGLVGQDCEYIERNRGPRSAVAPLLPLRDGLWAWLGYREEWDEERAAGKVRRFSFRSASMTIHFGMKRDRFKPQMFRAEWAGWARWAGLDYGFQGSGAGHPHWQFDVLESIPYPGADDTAALLQEITSSDTGDAVQEFGAALNDADLRDLVATQKISRMHFASAAAWWKTPPQDIHTHCPEGDGDLERWVQACLRYLKVELNRLV